MTNKPSTTSSLEFLRPPPRTTLLGLAALVTVAALAACSPAPRDSAAGKPLACENGPGWGPLRWSMTPEAAGKALDGANIKYRYDEARAYFVEPTPTPDATPSQGSASSRGPAPKPPAAPISHTTSPHLLFERSGFSVTVRFDEHDHMSEVALESPLLRSRAAAETIVEDLVRCYGPARHTTSGAGSVSHRWERPTWTLWAAIFADAAAGTWRVSERFTPPP